MPSVMFNFHPEVPEERRDAVLTAIRRWGSVLGAALLKPDAKNELTKRMAYAQLAEAADIETIIKKISDLPEVESASMPAKRRML
jgi:hypothetical protein